MGPGPVAALLALAGCGGVTRMVVPPPRPVSPEAASVSPSLDVDRAARLRAYVRDGLPDAPPPPREDVDPFDPVTVDLLVAEAATAKRYLAALTLLTAATSAGSAPAREGLERIGHAAGDAAAVLRATDGPAGSPAGAPPRGDGERMAWRAEALAAVGRLAEADELLIAAGGADPPLGDVGFRRAKGWETADPARALAVLELPTGSQRVAGVALQARLLVATGERDRAEAVLTAAERTWPGSYDLLAARVTLATARGDLAAALAACDAMPGIGAAGVHRQRARVLARFGEPARALAELDGDDSSAAWELRAELEAALGRSPDEALDRAVARDPSPAAVAMWAHRRMPSPEPAGDPSGPPGSAPAPSPSLDHVRAVVLAALDRHPGESRLWAALAEVERARGRPAASATAWGEALARHGDWAAANAAAREAAGWR